MSRLQCRQYPAANALKYAANDTSLCAGSTADVRESIRRLRLPDRAPVRSALGAFIPGSGGRVAIRTPVPSSM